MKPITKSEFTAQAKKIDATRNKPPYWTLNRWEYTKIAIDMAMAVTPATAIEAGAYGIPILKGSMTLDKKTLPGYPDILWDLNKTPYPFRAGQFDIFIALQVFEHIPEKLMAFSEARRIAKNIILSLPYNQVGNTIHCNIGDKEIETWFGKPDRTATAGPRIVCCWEGK